MSKRHNLWPRAGLLGLALLLFAGSASAQVLSPVVNRWDGNTYIAGSIQVLTITREVPLPLHAWIECTTDAGANFDFSSGADAFPDLINSATDGLGFTLDFDATGGSPDTARICTSLKVPVNYSSGGALVARVLKSGETGANTEVINCAGSIDGAALLTAGTVTVTGATSQSVTCTPTLTSLAAGDSLSLTAYITSGGTVDDTVKIASLAFSYAANN